METALRAPKDGVYVSLDELVYLRAAGSGIHFLPRQPIHSLLSGRHASRLRGRGLMFEEMRAYVPGDDIRTMDWKATARTQSPFVRVYNEERDRSVLLVVDQSISMFFGSRENLKSVTAAHAAALAAWRAVHVGDRVGALIYDDTAHVYIKPDRSNRNVMAILGEVQRFNHRLDAEESGASDPGALDRALASIMAMTHHDVLVVVISDFEGAGPDTRERITRLRRHNDVLAVAVKDPVENRLPDVGELIISNGAMQISVDTASADVRGSYEEHAREEKARIENISMLYDVPCLFLSTHGDVATQVRGALHGALGQMKKTRRL